MMEEKDKRKPQALIEVIDSGPLRITGNYILKDMKRENETTPGEILLCRCGKSCKKPFCDVSHKIR